MASHDSGKLTESRPQPRKARLAMRVSELGRFTFVSLPQPSKAEAPMTVRLSGSSSSSSATQSLKALLAKRRLRGMMTRKVHFEPETDEEWP